MKEVLQLKSTYSNNLKVHVKYNCFKYVRCTWHLKEFRAVVFCISHKGICVQVKSELGCVD